jgi:4-aminobutyrate aminotransferase/(S)-3-amino-2-methylpropionate transaminase
LESYARAVLGASLPSIRSALPGALGARWVELLARTESPALTARRARRQERSGTPQDPIVWQKAVGANVVDVDGNVFVDFTSGFGVAALGHRHPQIVAAIVEQTESLLHALGDLQPSDVKIALLEKLATLGPWTESRVILGAHGADAIEAALKTAMLHNKRAGVLAFEGGYHGLSHGPLALCGYQPAFRAPFAAQLNPHVAFARYPDASTSIDEAMSEVRRAIAACSSEVGAIVVEPMLGRGGVVLPPQGFLRALRDEATRIGALLVVDEIYTGFHRAGPRFLFEEELEGAPPDLICIGKALGGGLPMSACLGDEKVMRAWGDPDGEAIHTATFFGHPLACASAIAMLDLIASTDMVALVRSRSEQLTEGLAALVDDRITKAVRGRGLALGLELDSGARTLRWMRLLLERGYLVVPAGADASVLQIAPPLNIDPPLIDAFLGALRTLLREETR